MKKKYGKWILAGGIILIASLGMYVVKVTSISVEQSKEEALKSQVVTNSAEKIFINGVVVPMDNKDIHIDATKGKVKEVLVTDGQEVGPEDVLFTYDNETIADQIEELNSQIESTNKQKERVENKSWSAKKKLDEKNHDINIINEQIQAGDPNGPANLAATQAEVQALEAERSGYKEQITNFNDSIDELNRKIAKLQEDQEYQVKAEISGIVHIVGTKEDMVNTFLTISSNELYIKGSVSEKYIAKLQKDQPAIVQVVATNEKVGAKVDEINFKPQTSGASAALGASENSLSTYQVTLKLDSKEGVLEGYHVQATVFQGEKELLIPRDAVIEENGKTYVYKVVDHTLKKQEITYKEQEAKAPEQDNDKQDTNKQDSTKQDSTMDTEQLPANVLVVSGLQEEEEIISNPSSTTKEGMMYE